MITGAMRKWFAPALVGAAAVGLLASTASGQSGRTSGVWYAELGGGYVTDDPIESLGVLGRLGYERAAPSVFGDVLDSVAFEGELLLPLIEDDDSGVELDTVLSADVRGLRRLTSELDGFLRLGVSRLSADDDDDVELLFGFGGEYAFSRRTGLRADFSFQNDLEILSLTYTRDF